MDLEGRRIVLGVTGGIAAYKACELARRLQDEGAQVQAVMTPTATRFVTPLTLQALTGAPVHVDEFGPAHGARAANGMAHIELSRAADAVLVAPASANFLARLAHGFADDLLAALALARRRDQCPLLLAPAMNVEMWRHPATRRNVRQLELDGALVLGPAEGAQACGEVGDGRMLEPRELIEELVAALQPKPLAGRRVLLTAGPTYEPIDPVRGITNLSSGKMGYALARAAREAGAEVTLVSGPTALACPRGVLRVEVATARAMHAEVMARAAAAEVFIAVAAVADWRVEQASEAKLKKVAGAGPVVLALVPNPDILAEVAALPGGPYCVGFAAESERVVEHARAKLVAKHLPLVVANLAQQALGADESELVLVEAGGETPLPRAAKLAQARRVLAAIATRLAGGGARP